MFQKDKEIHFTKVSIKRKDEGKIGGSKKIHTCSSRQIREEEIHSETCKFEDEVKYADSSQNEDLEKNHGRKIEDEDDEWEYVRDMQMLEVEEIRQDMEAQHDAQPMEFAVQNKYKSEEYDSDSIFDTHSAPLYTAIKQKEQEVRGNLKLPDTGKSQKLRASANSQAIRKGATSPTLLVCDSHLALHRQCYF